MAKNDLSPVLSDNQKKYVLFPPIPFYLIGSNHWIPELVGKKTVNVCSSAHHDSTVTLRERSSVNNYSYYLSFTHSLEKKRFSFNEI